MAKRKNNIFSTMGELIGLSGVSRKRSNPYAQGGLPIPEWNWVGDTLVLMHNTGEEYINRAYRANIIVHSIIHHIADKASDAPGRVYRVIDPSKAQGFKALGRGAFTEEVIMRRAMLKSQAFEHLERHPFERLINDSPNPVQTGKQLRRDLHGYKLITGNSFMYASTAGAKYARGLEPQRLWCIPSPSVTIVRGDRWDPVKGYKVEYWGEGEIPKANMAHFKEFNPVPQMSNTDWLYGMSRLCAARGSLAEYENAVKAQGTMFKNMGPSGILSGNRDHGPDSEEIATAIQDKYNAKYTGLDAAGQIMVTSADVKYTQIGISPVDLNIIEAKGDLVQAFCALFNYPVERITGSANKNSQETTDIQVVTSCVMPLINDFDDVMTKYIQEAYEDEDLVYISDTQFFPELQKSMKQLTDWLERSWWLGVEERRRAMDYDGIPEDDTILVPAGLVPYKEMLKSYEDLTPGGDIDLDLLDNQGALHGDGKEKKPRTSSVLHADNTDRSKINRNED